MSKSKLVNEMASSSEDDEQVSTEGSGFGSDMKTPPPPQPLKKRTQYSSFEEESESESESDADSPPKKSEKVNPNINLLASKPIPSQKPRPQNPNQSNSHSPPPVNNGKRKRKATEVENEAPESKIAKTADVEKKPLMFQRVWSEGDEIVLMEGMIRYVETTTKDPMVNVNDFHQFVKNSLKVDVNNKQMRDKIKRLKDKFKKNVCVPHQKKMFELSDKLWGGNGNRNVEEADQKLKGSNCKPVVFSEAIVNGGVESVVHSGGGGIKIPITDEDIMNRGLELLSGSKKVEKKWRDLKVEELNHYLKKLEILKEQGELVLNAINKSGAS